MLLAIYGWGAYVQDKSTCARTLAENAGGHIHNGGVYEGHYGINQYPQTNGFASPPKDVV